MWLALKAGRMERRTAHSAGYDLFSNETAPVTVRPGERVPIATGVITRFQQGHVALIRDKSGHARSAGITVLGGVIDADYEQEWVVILLNTGKEPFVVQPGNAVAQAVFLPLPVVTVTEGDVTQKHDKRTGGFGSTETLQETGQPPGG